MQILFGTQHDGLHIAPAEPNGYEWWYFDAVSDDEKYILVVIFFWGTPMSPYYKLASDGRDPLPSDWCGVFVSLHERTPSGYRERTYAYNIYRGGDFAADGATVAVGGSRFEREVGEGGADVWRVSLRERGLWLGETVADLTFTATMPRLSHPAIPGDESHTWVCVAPDCRVSGTITAGRDTLTFFGRGYHDHNFGRLPWADTKRWYWSRVHFPLSQHKRGAVSYLWLQGGKPHHFFAVWDDTGTVQIGDTAMTDFSSTLFTPGAAGRLRYGGRRDSVRYALGGVESAGLRAFEQTQPLGWTDLQTAPFYRRYPVVAKAGFESGETASCVGVGEMFEPAKLCGEIMSRALWTRLRRRS